MATLNPVRLQAENIDLRARLNAMEEQIAALRAAVSQGAVHIYHNGSNGSPEATSALSALDKFLKATSTSASGKNATTSMSLQSAEGGSTRAPDDAAAATRSFAARIAALEAELAASQRQMATTKEEFAANQMEVQAAKDEISVLEGVQAGIEDALRASQEAEQAAVAEAQALRARVAALEKQEADRGTASSKKTPTKSCAVANPLDPISPFGPPPASPLLSGAAVAPSPLATGGRDVSAPLSEPSPGSTSSAADVQAFYERILEQRLREREEQLTAHYEAEFAKFRAQYDAVAETCASLQSQLNTARAECAIEARMKQAALDEAASATRRAAASGASSPAGSPPGKVTPGARRTDGQDDLDALLGTMAHQQQENPAHKPGQRQSLDDDDFADMMGPPPPSGAAAAASTEELRKQLAAAKSEADALRAQLEALQRQQDQASSDAAVVRELTEQQARLQRDRSAEMQEQRRAELLAHFQRRSQEDKATSKEIFESTCTSYQTLVRQLAHAQRQARAIAQRAAAAGDDPRVAEEGVSQEEVLYSILFDYERRLWHLNNDLLSLRAIVDIHGADISHEARRVRESLETTIAILRMQLKEAHLQPHA